MPAFLRHHVLDLRCGLWRPRGGPAASLRAGPDQPRCELPPCFDPCKKRANALRVASETWCSIPSASASAASAGTPSAISTSTTRRWRDLHPGGELVAALGEEHPAIGAGGRDALALQSRDHLDRGRVRYAQSPGDVGRPRLTGSGEQVGDQLDIVLDQCRRLRRARLAEPARLGELRREIGRV